MYNLDWTHAWTGRLAKPELASPLSPRSPRSGNCAARLAGELAAEGLPFLNLPFAHSLTESLGELEPFLRGFKHMVLLGIGGSALGPRALQKAFFPQQDRPGHNGPWLWIMDNVGAEELSATMENLNPAETLVVVVSKSGGTIETLAQYFFLRKWLQQSLGSAWTEHLLLITDAAAGYLREEAERLHCLSLPVPEHLGGRYSVLSAVGMVPAAFMGLSWRGILAGAARVNENLVNTAGDPEALARHPAWMMAEWAHALIERKYSQLIFFTYIPAWSAFGQWFGQLWAESLGKDGRGSMPIPAVGVTDQHSLQQMFLDGPKDKGCIQVFSLRNAPGGVFPPDVPEQWSWLRGKHFGDLLEAECLGTAAALAHRHVPLLRAALGAAEPEAAGELMGLCMAATLFTGWLLDINPLDQPSVELGKRLAYARLGAQNYSKESAMLSDFHKGRS